MGTILLSASASDPSFLGNVAVTLGAIAISAGIAVSTITTLRRSTSKSEIEYRRTLSEQLNPDLSERDAALAAYLAEVTGSGGQPPNHESTGPGGETPIDKSPATSDGAAGQQPTRVSLSQVPIDYHAQVLAQSQTSFTASLVIAVLGFLIITAGIILAFVGVTSAAIASTLAGVVSELVASLFFTQSNKARSVMAGQLLVFGEAEERERQALEREKLITMVSDDAKRDQLISETVLILAEKQSTGGSLPHHPAEKVLPGPKA